MNSQIATADLCPEATLDGLIAECLKRADAGEAVDPRQIAASHPHLTDELLRFFENAALIEGLAVNVQGSHSAPQAASQDTSRLGMAPLSSAADDTQTLRPHGTTCQSEPEPLPQEFGRYRVLRRLGEGGMGTVFLALDTALGRQVALKVAKGVASAHADVRERLLREARAAASLSHRNLCPVYDVGEIDGVRHIAMAYIQGETLAARLNRGAIASDQAAALIGKLADALQFAHDHGVLHRDLKPSNIMLDQAGEPVIMDFGLARCLSDHEDARLTQSGAVVGSPAYMSPEQCRGEVAGPGSDIYGLGVILYEMLAGRPPFHGVAPVVMSQILSDRAPPLREAAPESDPALAAVCERMMAPRIEDRFSRMSEVSAAMAIILNSPVTLPRRTASQAKRRLRSPMPAILLACVGVAMLLALGVVLTLRTPQGTVRIEVLDPRLNVTIDEKQVVVRDAPPLKLPAGSHELSIELNGQAVRAGETVQIGVERRKLSVMLGATELRSDNFRLVRGDNPALVISLIPLNDAPSISKAQGAMASTNAAPNSVAERLKQMKPRRLLEFDSPGVEFRVVTNARNWRRVYEGGAYRIEHFGRGLSIYDNPFVFDENALELRLRLVSSKPCHCGFALKSQKAKQAIVIWLTNQGTLSVHLEPETPELVSRHDITHTAVRPGDAENALLLVVRPKTLEVFVNGESVAAPIPIFEGLLPAGNGLRFLSGGPANAELKRMTLWQLED